MDFASLASTPGATGRGGSSFPKAEMAVFFTALLAAHVRMSYTAFARLVHAVQGRPGARKNDGNTGGSLVGHLAPEAQPLVCKTGGSYADGVAEAWAKEGIDVPSYEVDGETIPLHKWKVLEGDAAIAAYEMFLRDQEEDDAE